MDAARDELMQRPLEVDLEECHSIADAQVHQQPIDVLEVEAAGFVFEQVHELGTLAVTWRASVPFPDRIKRGPGEVAPEAQERLQASLSEPPLVVGAGDEPYFGIPDAFCHGHMVPVTGKSAGE